MRKKIVIISGDPNSVNSEIIYKSWKKLSKNIRKKIFLISNYDLLKDQFKQLNYKLKIKKVKNIFEIEKSDQLKVLHVNLKYNNPFKVSNTSSSKFVIKTLNLAHNLALNKDVAGIINCPISKNLLRKKNIGVTEFLASKCKVKDNSEVMIIRNKKLSISPITTHSDIKTVSKKIKKKLIIKKVKVINKWFKNNFYKKPKIALLGLNPHNAELRKNSEESKNIIPAIKSLKRNGINISGPFASDTIFINDYKNHDIIIGMYHDQVLSPFKALFKFDAINITLGLKYIRVSPDHGVATDKILLKKSNPASLLKCIHFLSNLSE